YVHKKDIGESARVKLFIKKRVIRVYPIYWVVLVCLVPVYFIIPSFGSQQVLDPYNLIESFFLIPQPEGNLPLNVAWSLSYEILFYCMFCLLIFLDRKIAFPIMFSWIGITVVHFCIQIIYGTSNNYWINFLFNPFILEFFSGVFIAYIILKNYTKNGLFFLTLGVLGVFISWINKNNNFIDFHRVIEYGLPFVLIIYGLVSYEIEKSSKPPKLLVYFGDASYSIYLIHYPMLSVVNKIFLSANLYSTMGSVLGASVMIVITIIVGCVFHTVIEKPLLKFLNTILHPKRNNSRMQKIKSA
ncbi:acyltransferase family protein, partial [Bacillus sp. JJ1764]|uniref:acyltransferase family protein n=1 Tax=Bacillus sp. JJ1764 TaxID=3122964 RepID=UPI002FFF4E19